MPCLEHMLDAFAFDQSTREDGAKFGRPISWLESFHVHPAGQVKKFFLRKTTYAKGVAALSDKTSRRSASWYSSMKRFRWSNSLAFHDGTPGVLLADSVLFGQSTFFLPPSRCQVGISTMEGMRRCFATCSDRKQSPDQL